MAEAMSDKVAVALNRIADSLAILILHMDPMKDGDLKDKIAALHVLGFDRHRIAALLGTTANTVSVRLSEMKLTAKRKG